VRSRWRNAPRQLRHELCHHNESSTFVSPHADSISAGSAPYEKVTANNGGDASSFARFYPVPGMTHGVGGPATAGSLRCE
jgi:hypothetical protein